ncbi:flippase [Candidatus Woesearchaeota archaeon]|nr:flippase [Candidatus Woesearchaeota archaeon]
MSLVRKVVFGTTYIFLFSVIAAGLGYVVRLLIARSLTTAEYGLFYAIFSLFTFFTIFGHLGMTEAVQKLIPEYIVHKEFGKIKGLITITIALQLAIFGIVSIVAIVFAKQLAVSYFHSVSAVTPIILLAVMFWLRPIVTLLSSVFVGFQQLKYFAFVDSMKMFFVLVLLGISFHVLGKSIIGPSIAYLGAFILLPLVLIPFFLRVFPSFFSTKMDLSKELLRRIFLFGIPMMVSMAGGNILVYTDTLMLTYFRTLEEVGLYQAAYPTANLLLYLPGAITAIILPLSSELWELKEKVKLQVGTELLYKYTLIIMVFLAIVTAAFARQILSFLFGGAYLDASVPLIILSLGAILFAIATINITILSGIGKPKVIAKIVLLAAGVNVFCNFFVVPAYGMVGAAFTTVLGYIIILGLTLLKIKEYAGAKISLRLVAKHTLVGVLFSFFLLFLGGVFPIHGIISLAVIATLGLLLYVPLLFLFRIMTREDMRFLKEAIARK